MAKNKVEKCSFCGRSSDVVDMMVGAGDACLCVDCAMAVSQYVQEIYGDELAAMSKKSSRRKRIYNQ